MSGHSIIMIERGEKMTKKSEETKLFGVQKEQIRNLTKKEFEALRLLCRLGKNMYNVALYNVRQHFFSTGKYLSYKENNQESKPNENYQLLNTDVAQQILKKVDENFNSFFALKKKKEPKARIPQYLEKEGYFEITFPRVKIQKDGNYFLPMSPAFKHQYGKISLPFPTNLIGKKLSEIRIQPKCDANYFEIEYVYLVEKEEKTFNSEKALIIDLGLNNLCSVVTTDGASFIIDGKPLKSKNHWYNKQNAKLQSIKDKQGIIQLTNNQRKLLVDRNNFVNDYLNKTVRYLVNYCIEHRVGNVIIGYNKGWKDNIKMGKRNNQNFVQVPHGKLKAKLKSLCERYGIKFLEQEESYTSKASFLDGDFIPVFQEGVTNTFSGKRVKRGLYKTKNGFLVNSDIHGACNILRKSGFSFNVSVVTQALLQNPKKVELLTKKTCKDRSSDESVGGRLTFPTRREKH